MATRALPPIDVQNDTSFFGHPRGLATLFFTEMWERFSYYGMRALLMLYMVDSVKGGFGFDKVKAGAIYGPYTSLVYLMCLAGGWFADKFTGQRRAVLIGGLFITAGEFCLMVPSEPPFYLGLLLLVLGTGLLKGNVSTIVGQLYRQGDPRRDAGFSIFYMGINLGAFISPLICGWLGQRISWRLGFGAAGLGMLAGVVQYVLTQRHLGTAGLVAEGAKGEDRAKNLRTLYLGIGGAVLLGALLYVLSSQGIVELTAERLSDALGWGLVLISVIVFSSLIFLGDWSAAERRKAGAIFVLFVASVMFWASFEQAGSSLNLFADEKTNCVLFGIPFPSSWYQSVQPIFVILFAPLFAWLWMRMSDRQPSSPTKFTLGLFFAALAFAVMIPAANIAMGGGKAGPMWLVVCYFLQTIGEMCLSPVGLSTMSKLAPVRAGGFMMGVWFLSISIGNWMAGKAASMSATWPLPTLFTYVTAASFAAALVLALLIRPTKKLMGEVN